VRQLEHVNDAHRHRLVELLAGSPVEEALLAVNGHGLFMLQRDPPRQLAQLRLRQTLWRALTADVLDP